MNLSETQQNTNENFVVPPRNAGQCLVEEPGAVHKHCRVLLTSTREALEAFPPREIERVENCKWDMHWEEAKGPLLTPTVASTVSSVLREYPFQDAPARLLMLQLPAESRHLLSWVQGAPATLQRGPHVLSQYVKSQKSQISKWHKGESIS